MNSKDKKIYKSVVRMVKNMESGKIMDKDEFSSICREYGFNIRNPVVMLTHIVNNTYYLERLGNGNYLRTDRK